MFKSVSFGQCWLQQLDRIACLRFPQNKSSAITRNIRVEEDLIDTLFNSTEKRLARTLLLLARYGKKDQPDKPIPKISQETLAEMIGTTRSRVNLFMSKFKKLGSIHNNGDINSSHLVCCPVNN